MGWGVGKVGGKERRGWLGEVVGTSVHKSV